MKHSDLDLKRDMQSKESLALTLVLPFPLATWNRLLAMNHWQRKKYRDFVHSAVYMCIRAGNEKPIQTVSLAKLSSMGWKEQEYYKLIRPNTSRTQRKAKQSARKGKQKKR